MAIVLLERSVDPRDTDYSELFHVTDYKGLMGILYSNMLKAFFGMDKNGVSLSANPNLVDFTRWGSQDSDRLMFKIILDKKKMEQDYELERFDYGFDSRFIKEREVRIKTDVLNLDKYLTGIVVFPEPWESFLWCLYYWGIGDHAKKTYLSDVTVSGEGLNRELDFPKLFDIAKEKGPWFVQAGARSKLKPVTDIVDWFKQTIKKVGSDPKSLN